MPIGAENVGTAYVRILADGDGLDESIRDMFDDEEGEFDRAGRENSATYRQAFQEEMGKAPNRTALQKSITESIAKINWRKEFTQSRNWKEFRGSLRKTFGDAGDLAGQTFESHLLRGMDPAQLKARMGNINAEVAKAQATLRKNELALEKAQTQALIEDKQRAFLAEMAMLQDAHRENQAYDRRRARSIANLRTQMQLLTRESAQLLAGDRRAMGKSDLLDLSRTIAAGMRDLRVENALWAETLKDTDTQLVRLRPRLNQVNASIDHFADGMGRAFGRGARNDLVNFIGSAVRGIARLPRLATGLFDILTSAGGVTTLLGRGLAGLAGAFTFVGPLVASISLAAGAVTALASSLAMGLAGAAGAAAGALLPVIAGIGTMVLAFQNAPPEAKKAMRSIKSEFSGLGDAAGRTVFSNVTEQARRFRAVIDDATPVVRGIGNAISDVADNWLDMMEGPGFSQFQNAMGRFLPNAVRSLGTSFGQALGGMGGLLRGLLPLTERFLGWLNDITGRFNNWANSVRGQTAIRDFFNDAGDAAADLGGFLGSVIELLGEVMRAGSGPGNSLIRDMTSQVRDWIQTLNRNPEILRNWFRQAGDFARGLGRLVRAIGRVAGALDNEFSRAIANVALDGLVGAIRTLGNVLAPIGRLFDSAGSGAQSFLGVLATGAIGFGLMNRGVNRAKTNLGGFVGGLRDSERRMGAVRGAAGNLAGVAGFAGLSLAASSGSEAVKVFGSAASGALLGLSVGGPIGAAIGGAGGLLLGFASAASEGADSANAFRPEILNLAGTFDQLTGSATRATRAMLAAEYQERGTFRAAETLGIANRDLISATLGNESAQIRVANAMERARSGLHAQFRAGEITRKEYFRLNHALEVLGTDLPMLTRKAERQAAATRELGQAGLTWKEVLQGIPRQVHSEIKALGAKPALSEVRQLARQYDLTPKQVRTILRATNADLTRRQVRNLTTDYRGIPNRVETRLDALNWDVTAGQVAGLIDQYNLTPKQVATLLKTVGFKKGSDEAKAVTARMKELDRQDPEAKADVDTKAAMKKVRDTIDILNIFGGKKGTATADVNNDPGKNSINSVSDLLRIYGGRRGTATADANNAPGRSALGVIGGLLTSFGGRSVSATASVNVNRAALDNLIGDMGNLDTNKVITITTNHVSTYSGRIPRRASGGIHSGAQMALIGESGPEAIVPLNRPLNQVDPAVRELSAIAQGLQRPRMAAGGVAGAQKYIDASGWTITSPSEDPRAVAVETVNTLVAKGY